MQKEGRSEYAPPVTGRTRVVLKVFPGVVDPVTLGLLPGQALSVSLLAQAQIIHVLRELMHRVIYFLAILILFS